MMWRLQDSGAIFVCVVSVKLRLLFTAGGEPTKIVANVITFEM